MRTEELVAALFGFLAATIIVDRLLSWVACLWVTYKEYRIAVDYPHLRRPKRLFVFVPLTVLHSGPWVVVVAVFAAFELFVSTRETWHFWFLGGFLVYLMLMGVVAASFWKRRKHASAAQHTQQ